MENEGIIYFIEHFINQFQFNNLCWKILTPIIFSITDVVTGFISAMIKHEVSSTKMRIGLLHKLLLLIIIILSFIADKAFCTYRISIFVCGYIIIMESISILENLEKSGIKFKFKKFWKEFIGKWGEKK